MHRHGPPYMLTDECFERHVACADGRGAVLCADCVVDARAGREIIIIVAVVVGVVEIGFARLAVGVI